MFKCSLCAKTFKNVHLRAEHELIHSDARQFECDVPTCTCAFKGNRTLRGT